MTQASHPYPPDASDDDEEPKHLCYGCIAEDFLRAEIKLWGRRKSCSYCGKNRKAVTLTAFARRVDPVYREMVGFVPDTAQVWGESDRVAWVGGGSSPGMVLAELFECEDTQIAEDIITYLGRHHAWDINDDDADYYDDSSESYRLTLPDNPRYNDAWDTFCRSLKFERRFFNDAAVRLLDQILGPILDGKLSAFASAVRTIGPESPDRFVFRARLANDEVARRTIYASPLQQLGPPPPHLTTAGRMNTAGIAAFYASGDPSTAVAELRAPVGGVAIVGKFEIIRPVRLLDLNVLEQAQNALSCFHPDFMLVHNLIRFIPGFHREIMRPVIPGQEALEYLPTQVVAEYLWTREEAHRVDGLIFGSSQVSGGHTNVAIFSHACTVEGAKEEPLRTVSFTALDLGDEDAGPDYAEHVYFEPLAAPPERPASRLRSSFDEDDTWMLDFEEKLALRQKAIATLRLDCKDIRRMIVQSIQYKTDEATVRFREKRRRHDDYQSDPF